jgi:hypothetical protein
VSLRTPDRCRTIAPHELVSARRVPHALALLKTGQIVPLRRGRVIALDLSGRVVRSFDGVPAARIFQLLQGRLDEVDAEYVGQTNQVNGHVAELRTNTRPKFLVLHDGSRLLRGEPLQLCQELTNFPGQGHSEVLRRMKLLPVPFPREGSDAFSKLSDRGQRFP